MGTMNKGLTNNFGDAFRNYETGKRQEIVEENYRRLNTQMTVDEGRRRRAEWLAFDKGSHTVMEIIKLLDTVVDDSDPDNNLPNSIHDYQTAERIRKEHPGEENDWFHLVGFLHDLGKIMVVWGEPQWAVVGDTFPLGCAPDKSCAFHQFFAQNPDASHPVYSTPTGVYKEGCGVDALEMSWGHDEYMYQVLRRNGCTIPKQGLDMIRYHSFYPWHTCGAYSHLEDSSVDNEKKEWVLKFNKFDLYSKADEIPNIEAIRPYYEGLLVKYGIDGKLQW
eukprot:Rhum_TRINITY_DN15079_c0_g2::Rhum_TRINITY_DN15079_c0_g2_i1::g.136863::m.136863/K00469/MIOX; inositol oxygenase